MKNFPKNLEQPIFRRAVLAGGGILAGLVFFGAVSCSKAPEDGRKIKMYQSPMHPWITSDKPGECTICGMALVPVYADDENAMARKASNSAPVVALNPQSIGVLNVTTVPVRRMELTKALRFSGVLEDDENRHRVIAAFYDGRVDAVYIDHVGVYVTKGTPLAGIYSPELLYVVREMQNAVRTKNRTVLENSSRRLVQFGLSKEQVENLARQTEAGYTIDLLAPMDGTILKRNVFMGQYIKTGEPLFEMGDLRRMWFHAEVYERDLPDIRLGQKVILRTPTVPGREFDGEVTMVDPNFDPRTRSTKVRIEVDNPESEDATAGLRRLLPHQAYAEAYLTADLGEGLVVPRSAVLRDGRRSVAYVAVAEGRYEQRRVRVGRVGDEGVEILEGLTEGERVVVQGNLMIDAEAQLQSGGDIAVASVTSEPSNIGLPPPLEVVDFFEELIAVSQALAQDDAVAAIKAGKKLPELAAKLPASGHPAVDAAVEELKKESRSPAGSDLKAVRETFLPWSVAGSRLALALRAVGWDSGPHIFECPMTGDSFPGAPSRAQWIQSSGTEASNPYFGAEMPNCGAEVKP